MPSKLKKWLFGLIKMLKILKSVSWQVFLSNWIISRSLRIGIEVRKFGVMLSADIVRNAFQCNL